MRNLWCLEKNSILPLVISATGIVPQSLFKNLKILDLDNTLVVVIWRTSPKCRKRPVGEFCMGRVRQWPYKTSFLCYFFEFAPFF
jgi:hypothetical protein